MKKIKIYIFYFVLVIYSLEALLFLFMQEKILSKEDIKNKRIEISKKKGLEFDVRTPEEAFLDFKKNNEDLGTNFYYSPIFASLQTFKNAKKHNNIIPFKGPINSKTLTCAEEGKYILVQNDKFGFKNSNHIYKKKINSMLLGDSAAEGHCQDIDNDIAGYLTKKGFATVNFGVTGTSVLVALGIMREFGEIIKPKNFIFLYQEANDLEGLNWSKKDNHLMHYMNDGYSINYLDRYDEIENFLKLSSSETMSYIESTKGKNNLNKKNNLEILKDNFVDILELKKIKNVIKYKILGKKYVEHDLDLLFSVIKKMNEEAKKYNSNFIFVYNPDSSRYISVPSYAYLKEKQAMSLKKVILEKVSKMNISIIDLTSFFDKDQNAKEYFSLGYVGHYNANGYKKISEIIFTKLN